MATTTATTREQLTSAAAAVATMLRDVGTVDLARPTPCREWDLRELAQHAVGTTTGLAKIGRKEELGPDPWAGPGIDATDWNAVLADNVEAVARAWNNDHSWSGSVELGTEMPAAAIGDMAYAEILLHGWDVARSVGADLDVTPAVAAALRRTIEETADMGRQLGVYGPAVALAADGSDFDHALGAAGRDPNWTVQGQH